jgi:hypothetical protein
LCAKRFKRKYRRFYQTNFLAYMQVVCEKVFLGVSLGFKSLGGTGLLASRHAEAAGLQPLLEACANPSGAKDNTRLKVP